MFHQIYIVLVYLVFLFLSRKSTTCENPKKFIAVSNSLYSYKLFRFSKVQALLVKYREIIKQHLLFLCTKKELPLLKLGTQDQLKVPKLMVNNKLP